MDQPLIQVNVHGKESLKDAILTFTSQMRDAYKTGELINNVGGFVSHDKMEFRACDLLDPAQFKAIFLLRPDHEFESFPVEPLTDEQLERLGGDAVYLRFSHMLVFQYALAHDELKPLIVAFCEELVAFSLRVNSSNELFFSSDILFGIYLLVLVAEKYPEYAYLIGEYYPEDSDFNQIMYHGIDYMAYLFHQHGYSNLMLDAMASCRYEGIRGGILTHYSDPELFVPNLLKCFLADESRYLYYKNALIEAFKRRPRDVAEYDPLDVLEDDFDALRDEYDDDDYQGELISREAADGELDDLMFHGRTIREEREALKKALFEAVKDVPLKDLWYYDQPVYDETTTLADIQDDPFYQEYHEHNQYETNESFFLECFDNGEEILAYIEENQNPGILDELKPVNLRKLAFEHKHYIYKRFDHFGTGFMRLSPNLEQDVTLEDIIELFMVTYQNPNSFDMDDDGEEAQNDKCLRILDVLVRLLGKKELTADELKRVCKDFELCSKEEAVARFTIRELNGAEIRRRLYHLINEPLEVSLGLIRLQEIHGFYQRDKAGFGEMFQDIIPRAFEDTPNDILACSPGLNQAEYARGAQLLSVAYVLSQEEDGFFGDQDLAPLWAFYNEHIFRSVYRELEGLNALPDSFDDDDERAKAPELLAKIKAYVDAQAQAPGGLMSRFMKEPIQDDSANAAITAEQALAFARELLVEDDEADEDEDRTPLFVSDEIGMLLASMLYAAKVAKAPQKKQLLGLYQLILQLFPSKTLLVSFLEFSDGGQFCQEATADEVEAFCDLLSDLKIDETYVFLARLAVVHKANEYDDDLDDFSDEYGLKRLYLRLLTIYRDKDKIDPDEPAMFAAREKKIAAKLSAAVELLDEEQREKFLNFV